MAAPSTPVLETWTQGDGAGWNSSVWSFPVLSGDNALPSVLSNAGTNGSGSTWASAYRSDISMADSEAYATLVALGTGQQEIVEMFVRIQNPGASPSFYQSEWYNSGVFNIAKIVAGTYTGLITVDPGPTRTIGDKVALQAIGTSITAWYYHSGAWTQIASVTDSSITGAGRVGLDISPLSSIDDFGAGAPSIQKIVGIFVPASMGLPRIVTKSKSLGVVSPLSLGVTRAPAIQKTFGINSPAQLGMVRSVKLLQAIVSPASIGLTNKKTNAWGSWSTVFTFTTTLASIAKQSGLISPAQSGYARITRNVKSEGINSVLAIGISRSTVTTKTHGRISPVSLGIVRVTAHVKTLGMSSALSAGFAVGQGAQRNLGFVSASSLGLPRVTRHVKVVGVVSGAQTGSQRLLAYVRVLSTIVSAASIGQSRIIRHIKTTGIVSAASLNGIPSKMLVLQSPVSMGFVKVLRHVKAAGAVSAASIGVSKVSAGVKTVGIVSPVSRGQVKANVFARLSGISTPLSTGTVKALAQARQFGIVSKPHISNPNVVVLVRIVGIVTPAKLGMRVVWTFSVDPNRYAPPYMLEADALKDSEIMSVGQGLS